MSIPQRKDVHGTHRESINKDKKVSIMHEVLSEITQLEEKDCFYIVERHKNEFTYPLHKHAEYELNFIRNGAGVRRVVGDSVEYISDLEMVLITGQNLEHCWEQGKCKSPDIREITIQFSSTLFSPELLGKSQFTSIKRMFERAEHGLAFPSEAIMKVYGQLDDIAKETNGFEQFLNVLKILYELSGYEGKILASKTFSHSEDNEESGRVQKVKEYINNNYQDNLKLETLASLVGMTPTSFSKYFKLRTGKTLSNYIIDIRLGIAARALVDSSQNISEICFACGFNNLSNFNRIFKAKRGMTPTEFRTLYWKTKVSV